LFVGHNGMDVTRAEYLHFTGQPVPVSSMCTGRKWILEDADLASCVRYYRDGVLNPRDWLGSYRGIEECAWYAADDLMPFLRRCLPFPLRALRKVFRGFLASFRSAAAGVPRNADGLG